jgi:Arc/MetJ family transcription regulator
MKALRVSLRELHNYTSRSDRPVVADTKARGSLATSYSSLHHDEVKYTTIMRTTIDLPEDLHAQAVAIARDTHQSLSQAVAGLIRRGLGSGNAGEIARSARTGLPVAHLGRTITSEDVRRLEDDDQ